MEEFMMQKYNNTKIIIGLDHGYGNIKTAHRAWVDTGNRII
jgi:hypothetical protein